MEKPVNKDLEGYRDDFFKGLTLRQTVLSLISVALGTGVFLLGTYALKLSTPVAFYLALPVVLPIAVSGFLKIHGMTPLTYLKRRRAVMRRTVFFFSPDFDAPREDKEGREEKPPRYLDEGGREEAICEDEKEHVRL